MSNDVQFELGAKDAAIIIKEDGEPQILIPLAADDTTPAPDSAYYALLLAAFLGESEAAAKARALIQTEVDGKIEQAEAEIDKDEEAKA